NRAVRALSLTHRSATVSLEWISTNRTNPSQAANQQKALIVGLSPMLSCSANHRCKHVAERLPTVGHKNFFEPLEAELGVARVEHLGETIGDERKEVASMKVYGCRSILLLLEHAEWQMRQRELVHGGLAVPVMQNGQMAGKRKLQRVVR